MIPLTEFICDHCGDTIESPEKGFLEWEDIKDENRKSRAKDFKIVHNDPSTEQYCATRDTVKSLTGFIGNNIGNLINFIDQGKLIQPNYTVPRALDLREFAEICRRLTIPYYEEARDYLHLALEDGDLSTNEYGLYDPVSLQSIIERYAPKVID